MAGGNKAWSLERYRVGEPVGAGTMGTVFRAYDPMLGREVAIKMLHPDTPNTMAATFGGTHREARGRFAAEARAMAALSHPNVVEVYDAGMKGCAAFIAMELIEGQTLQQWMKTRRAWREVVQLFVQAGRGLEAAHALGFVHRDFKPANVLIGNDGRARVTDFGLVTVAGECDKTLTDGITGAADDQSFTQTGMSVGTPAYMSPEQHFGSDVDERTDQFAFCVALFEALHGMRPFRARTCHDLARRKTIGEMSKPGNTRDVPAWLDKAVRRGLAADPDERWNSLSDLLAVLEVGLQRSITTRRRGKAFLAGALVALCTASVFSPPLAGASEDGVWSLPAAAAAVKSDLTDEVGAGAAVECVGQLVGARD